MVSGLSYNQYNPKKTIGTVGLMDMPLTGEILTTWSLMKMTAGNQRKYRHALVQVVRVRNWLLTLSKKGFDVGEEDGDDE